MNKATGGLVLVQFGGSLITCCNHYFIPSTQGANDPQAETRRGWPNKKRLGFYPKPFEGGTDWKLVCRISREHVCGRDYFAGRLGRATDCDQSVAKSKGATSAARRADH